MCCRPKEILDANLTAFENIFARQPGSVAHEDGRSRTHGRTYLFIHRLLPSAVQSVLGFFSKVNYFRFRPASFHLDVEGSSSE